jgi:hypothetical protein
MFADFLGYAQWQWIAFFVFCFIGYAVISALKTAGKVASSPLGQGFLDAWLK